MDSSTLGSSVHGILQARIPERVAIPFPGDLPDPGIEPRSPALQVDSLPSELPGKPRFSKKSSNMSDTCGLVHIPYTKRNSVQVGSAKMPLSSLWDEGSMRVFFTTFIWFYPCRTFFQHNKI